MLTRISNSNHLALLYHANKVNRFTGGGSYFYSSHIQPPTPIPAEKKVTRQGNGKTFQYLTDGQLAAELERCLNCATKPCQHGCPVNCSPADFIYAAKDGMKSGGPNRILPSSLARSAAEIMRMNPLGGVCGVVCPDTFCMKACAREALDQPIDIPSVQATIVRRARDSGHNPLWEPAPKNSASKKIAIVGAGPAGLACASVLARHEGVESITIFDRRKIAGGAARTIPETRLPTSMLEDDIVHIDAVAKEKLHWELGADISDFSSLKSKFDAVCIATGLAVPRKMGIPNEQSFAHPAISFLWKTKHDLEQARQLISGKRVVIIGGGAVAVDAATTSVELGAQPGGVSIIYRRGVSEMPLTAKERNRLLSFGVDVVPRQVPVRFTPEGRLVTRRAILPIKPNRLSDPHRPPQLEATTPLVTEGAEIEWSDVDVVIVAIGDDVDPKIKSLQQSTDAKKGAFYFAGDTANGASTVVQSSASGKNTAQQIIDDLFGSEVMRATRTASIPMTKSFVPVVGYNLVPADISVDFFTTRRLINPFILSASPMSDGFEQVDEAFVMGWGGAILKTTFDDVHFPVHVPNRYMERFEGGGTYGNCDNVSDHPMSRVAREVRELVSKWGRDKYLIGASTGGDMSGDLDHDRHSWQTNTRALEAAGAMVIEYSLSCPQGGEGAEANQIVSQSAVLAARVVEFILSGATRPDIPKLFKLTAAVAAVGPIISAMKAVFARFPDAKVGITLANSFPVMGFRDNSPADAPRRWPHGIVFGMAGSGVLPITYRTLSEASDSFPDLYISANGGIMDSLSAANVLALGCQSVQMCTLPTRDGINCIEHLNSGLAHLLNERKISSVSELIGISRWGGKSSIKGFMELPAKSQKSTLVHPETCISCGNCTRCPYLAIDLDPRTFLPIIDPEKCVGCSMCVLKCPTQSLELQ